MHTSIVLCYVNGSNLLLSFQYHFFMGINMQNNHQINSKVVAGLIFLSQKNLENNAAIETWTCYYNRK
jgi:hypothetical protein